MSDATLMTLERWRRVQSLFHEAVALPHEERQALLADACRSDAALRAEVERLLADPTPGGSSGTLDCRLPLDVGATELSEQVRAVLAPGPVGKLGEYELLGEAGRGGQGVVYKARQPRTGREVALKRLSAGIFATPEMRARFEREIEAAAALDHPNIVTVYGSEQIDDQLVLSMQWVDGAPFDLWAAPVGAPRREVREVLATFATVCAAIHYAHQRGVIHRDLKPSNLLVHIEGRPHVLDFGLAKLAADVANRATLTQTGDFVGTPAYAAPEVLRGRRRDVDVRSNVYALGAVLYQALTGRLPLEPSDDLAKFVESVERVEPPAPSTINHSVGRELDAITLKALAKDKEQRYPSADAFRADVERYLAGEAVLAHPPSRTYRMRKFVRLHWAAVGSAAAFIALLVAATSISTVLFLRAERERGRADTALKAESVQAERARKEAAKARSANAFVDNMLAKANRGAQQGNPNVTVREALDIAAADLESGNPAFDPEVEASVRMTIANTYVALGLGPAAEPHYRKALDLRQAVFGDVHLEIAETMEKLGRVYRVQGRLADAERMVEGALGIRRKLIADPYDGYFAVTLNGLGILRRYQGKFDEAIGAFRESLNIYRKSFGPDNHSIPVVLQNIGIAHLALGRPQEAEQALREALALAHKLHGDEHIDTASVKVVLAQSLVDQGAHNDDEASRLLGEALAMQRRLLGEQHPAMVASLATLATVRRRAGSLDETERLLREAVDTARRAGAWIDTGRQLGSLANVLQCQGALEEAEAAYREAGELLQARLAPDEGTVVMQVVGLGDVLRDLQRFEEAEAVLIEAEAGLAQIPDPRRSIDSVRRALVNLYDAWTTAEPDSRRAERAEYWRSVLAAADYEVAADPDAD